MTKKRPDYLKLLPIPEPEDMNLAQMYGKIFAGYADMVATAKDSARELMKDAIDKGVDLVGMDADFSLVELDLANVEYDQDNQDFKFVYIEPSTEPLTITRSDVDD